MGGEEGGNSVGGRRGGKQVNLEFIEISDKRLKTNKMKCNFEQIGVRNFSEFRITYCMPVLRTVIDNNM